MSVRRNPDFTVRPLTGFHDAGACPGVHDRAFLALLLLRRFGPLGFAELRVGLILHALLELGESFYVLFRSRVTFTETPPESVLSEESDLPKRSRKFTSTSSA